MNTTRAERMVAIGALLMSRHKDTEPYRAARAAFMAAKDEPGDVDIPVPIHMARTLMLALGDSMRHGANRHWSVPTRALVGRLDELMDISPFAYEAVVQDNGVVCLIRLATGQVECTFDHREVHFWDAPNDHELTEAESRLDAAQARAVAEFWGIACGTPTPRNNI